MFYFIRTRVCPDSEKQHKATWSLAIRFGSYEYVYDCPSMGTAESALQLKKALIAGGIENDIIIFEARLNGLRKHRWESAAEEQSAWASLNAYSDEIIVKADKCYEEWYASGTG